jgi:hypothetical protein
MLQRQVIELFVPTKIHESVAVARRGAANMHAYEALQGTTTLTMTTAATIIK